MIPASEEYRRMVYSMTYARHFMPSATLQIVDVDARQGVSYTATSEAPFSNLAQLTDEITEGTFNVWVMEDYQSSLDGTVHILDMDNLGAEQLGWCSEVLSDADGNYATPVELLAQYKTPATTIGRTYFFDTHYDSVPKDFDLIYYRRGVVIATEEFRDNAAYMVVSSKSVQQYDQLLFRVYSTTKGYRRIHMVEDVPGVIASYSDRQVISVRQNQVVDVLSKEVTSGEVTLELENSGKLLDIFNTQGIEAYLKRKKQPMDISIDMILPTGVREPISLGRQLVVDWKANTSSAVATFTCRDYIEKLTVGKFRKGVFSTSGKTIYDLAVEVLQDAGISTYQVDEEFKQIKITAPLPYDTHGEVLRLLAQAGRGVIVPTLDGGVRLRYFSTLPRAANKLLNASFDGSLTSWTQTGCSLDTTSAFSGANCVKCGASGNIYQNITLVARHKYYLRLYAQAVGAVAAGTYIQVNGTNVSPDFTQANLKTDTWTLLSGIYVSSGTSGKVAFVNGAAAIKIDSFMCLDLTETYGAGNEPDAFWCDENIRYFTGNLLVPPITLPPAQETLDMTVLMETPEVTLAERVKAVSVSLYNYQKDTTKTEVYQSTRTFAGTEQITVPYNSGAQECAATVQSLDSSGNPTGTNTAKLVKAEYYAYCAVLTITAVAPVRITVTGYAIKQESSAIEVTVSETDGEDKTEPIENVLITDNFLALDVGCYAAYWYGRQYQYSFEWRQNPAVEVLDIATVYDDVGKNNRVVLTERNLEYTSGVLGGDSSAIC